VLWFRGCGAVVGGHLFGASGRCLGAASGICSGRFGRRLASGWEFWVLPGSDVSLGRLWRGVWYLLSGIFFGASLRQKKTEKMDQAGFRAVDRGSPPEASKTREEEVSDEGDPSVAMIKPMSFFCL